MSAIFLLLLGACHLPVKNGCSLKPEPPALGACLGGEGLAWNGYEGAHLSLAGTVSSVGQGGGVDDCQGFGSDPGSDAVELGLALDDGGSAVLALALGGEASPVAEGEALTLRLDCVLAEFGPAECAVTLSTAEGTRLVLAVSGSEEGLVTPEGVEVRRGEPICAEADECGDWSAYDLLVRADGEEVTVPYAGSAEVGGWRVVHGGAEHALEGGGGGCPDWFVAHDAVLFLAH